MALNCDGRGASARMLKPLRADASHVCARSHYAPKCSTDDAPKCSTDDAVTLGLRLSELSSSRNPDYYGYHGLAADAALRLADHTRALHHVHAGLACGRLPPLQLLSFVVMEGTALFRLERRQEAAERLMTLDAHPVIQAFVAESQLDDFTNAIHGLYGDELSSADLNELVASFSDRVLQIANLWLLLKEDRGGSLLCALLRRYPSRRDDVESLARFYELDDRRRALHGLPDPDTWTTAPAPETCTNPPARPPDATLPDAVVPPADTSKVLDMGQAVTDAPEVLDTDRANLEAVPLADALEVLDKDHANTRRASLADRRASLLIELLRGRLDELTFGDLYLLLDTRLGEGLAERRLRELFPTAPAIEPAGEGERSPHLRWPALRRGPRVHRRGDGATRAFGRLPRHDRGAGLGPRDRSRTRRSPSSARPRPGAGHASCSPYAGRAVRVHRHHRAGRWARPHGLAAGRGMGPVHRHGDPREHPIRRIPRPRAAAHVAGRRAQPRRRAPLRPAVAPRSAGCVRRRGGITTWITVQIALLRVLHVLQGLYLAVGAATVALAIWTHLARRRAVLTRCRPGSDTRADG